jgi:hypothetical protein
MIALMNNQALSKDISQAKIMTLIDFIMAEDLVTGTDYVEIDGNKG